MTMVFEIFPDDADETADFYEGVLGFVVTDDRRHAELPYLGMARDEVRLGATTVLGPGERRHRLPPTGVEIVLEVDDLQAERDRVHRAGWPVAQDITLQPWGRRDFRLLDPNGYYLRLTERQAP
jgi:predicted enzyme related to lactoylglutathione lyase